MKSLKTVLLSGGCLAFLVLVLTAPPAEPFARAALAQNHEDSEPDDHEDSETTDWTVSQGISFERGILDRGALGQWFINGMALVLTDDSLVSVQDDPLNLDGLAEGREALVSGRRESEQFIVRHVLVFSVDESIRRGLLDLGPVFDEPLPAAPNDPN